MYVNVYWMTYGTVKWNEERKTVNFFFFMWAWRFFKCDTQKYIFFYEKCRNEFFKQFRITCKMLKDM